MHALLVAAGASRRMGFDKLLAPLAGRPVLWHSIHALARCPEVHSLTVVTRPEMAELVTELTASSSKGKPFGIVAGGAERHLSVWAGLQRLGAEVDFVAVHDAARPLVTPQAVAGCLALARRHGAASCAAPVSDTLKRADAAQMVSEGVDRTGLWGMQTPQIFQRALLVRAYETLLRVGGGVTDEVSAVEALGLPVALFHNPEWNLKITYPADVALAELMFAGRDKQQTGEGR
jgi:2-C-methyl-D-erythritol 4-phosphate cytidylyltransferase